jgi:16S rRNA (uracil1498-N3)-methyltransferase
MHRFFVDNNQIQEETVTIVGEDVHHITIVLKLVIGEKIVVCDRQGNEYYCIIKHINRENVILSIETMQKAESELETKIYLYQGIPKLDKMEWIIQKAVELGVYEIIPVAMTRSVVKINDNKADKKIARWNKIAESAAKQAQRAYIPKVKEPISFEKAVNEASTLDMVIVPYEKADNEHTIKKEQKTIIDRRSIGVFIGPEGGFDEGEITNLIAHESKIITLGKRILRTETASMTVLSILMYLLEAE